MPKDVLMMLVYNVSIPESAEVLRDPSGLVQSIRLPGGRLIDLYAEVQMYDEHDADPEIVWRGQLADDHGVEIEQQDSWKGLDALLTDARNHAEETSPGPKHGHL